MKDYGWFSVLPPVAAIALAIATRRVILSLLFGVIIAALMLQLPPQEWSFDKSLGVSERLTFAWDTLRSTVADTTEKHLWTSFRDPDHLRVFVFTMMMGAMIAVIHRAGGMQGVVHWLAPLARGRRGGQLVTWLLGLIIFIDDYANSLLLGNTMRPVTDRLRISREKLAYLVDSTAAPVSGLALISTWIAGEIGYIEEGFAGIANVNGFALFIETIPYRFYVLWALLLVPMIAILGRDWGPMLKAEERTLRDGPPDDGLKDPDDELPTEPRAINAILPILATIIVTVWLLYWGGWQSLQTDDALPVEGTPVWRQWMHIIGAGDSYLALMYGSASGLLLASVLVVRQRLLTMVQLKNTIVDGASHVLGALAILWLAWTLSAMTKTSGADGGLGTGVFLGGLLNESASPQWMPTIVFVLSSVVAFSTGTSWGTMGLLMPLVIASMSSMTPIKPDDPLMLATIGSVLAGAIFGDHCSPISDTTVLSSTASGCDHVAHVWTQMPYAMVVALASILFGTLPVGFGAPVWLMLPLGFAAIVVVMRLLGRRPSGAMLEAELL